MKRVVLSQNIRAVRLLPAQFLPALAAAGMVFVVTAPANADQLPKRKPGIWELSVTQEGGAPHTMKQCIDEKTDAKMQQTGSEMTEKMGGKCSKNTIKSTSNGFESETECQIAGSNMSSKGKFAGDFDSSYTGEVSTTYNPPMMGKSSSKTAITAKWVGPCTDGLVPGDMLLPNGMKMNIDQMSSLAQKGASMAANPQAQAQIEKMKAQAIQQMLKQQQMQQQNGAAPK